MRIYSFYCLKSKRSRQSHIRGSRKFANMTSGIVEYSLQIYFFRGDKVSNLNVKHRTVIKCLSKERLCPKRKLSKGMKKKN